MNQAARTILASYLTDGKIPTTEELGLSVMQSSLKDPVFVTLYKNGSIIASSGRIHAIKGTSAQELIENTLLCLKDARLKDALKTADDLASVQFRVDILSNGKRRVLSTIDALDTKKEGLIFLSQKLEKLAVLLPNITTLAQTPTEFFDIACKKAEIERSSLQDGDYVIYGFQTEVFSDF